MNIQITAYGLGSGHGEAAGGGYDDTDLRKQIAAVAEQVSKIANTRKEYQAAYVPKDDFPGELDAVKSVTIKFKKPFSKVPFVKATFDIKIHSENIANITNVTGTGFDIVVTDTGGFDSFQGLWYEAHLVD